MFTTSTLRRLGLALLVSASVLTYSRSVVLAADVVPQSPAAIFQELLNFREFGSVLHVAAHPDDENTQLITSLALGRNYRAAYLSVTRGDGGQNLLGPELGPSLGVARTQELIAARKIDGGEQFFTRALDFGYSKDHEETLRIWDRDEVLGDVVRVIRRFRPDVIITRFDPEGRGTHGHHTASAVLALEAFHLAGDPSAYPDQLDGLTVWQPKRIMLNGRGGGGRGRGGANAGQNPAPEGNSGMVSMVVSGEDPVQDENFASIAGRSRAMHKTQGFGNFGGRGGRGGIQTESFLLLAGEPALEDIMDGVDTTWNRIAGGALIAELANEVIEQFDPQEPEASVPDLLELKSALASVDADIVVDEKRSLLDRILQACLGLSVETVRSKSEVVPGELMELSYTVRIKSDIPVQWNGVQFTDRGTEMEAIALKSGQTVTTTSRQELPLETPLTHPYWLREEGTPGMARVDDRSMIGLPENGPEFPIRYVFEVGGQTLVVEDEPVEISLDSEGGIARTRLAVIPPASFSFDGEVALFAPGESREVEIVATANRSETEGTLQLEVPADWSVRPPSQTFRLSSEGERAVISFTVTAPSESAMGKLTARAEIGGAVYGNDFKEIAYDHIPRQVLQYPAQLKVVSLELSIRGQNIGYLPGAGDGVAESLREMGYQVRELESSDLTETGLIGLDAVVTGVRAFDVGDDMEAGIRALFDYVERGGTVVAQYNRQNGVLSGESSPMPLQISNSRITDENAEVTFLAPDHPVLNSPNKITQSDFDGWIQERGIYFPTQWDERFTPILAASDPGEEPLNGGLLVGKYGEGYFVYSGLVWFRELPAGVSGAYRIFANLVSLGK